MTMAMEQNKKKILLSLANFIISESTSMTTQQSKGKDAASCLTDGCSDKLQQFLWSSSSLLTPAHNI